MCGIGGFVGEGTARSLETLSSHIAHRGPDDTGIVLERGVALAHARLAIIDLSSLGHQPMWNDDRSLAIVFNGEIYNFKSLKAELEASGEHFKSNSDTEVILRLFEQEGEACFKKLVGMFAIALYDFKTRKLVLARDRMGEKPLYWSLQNGTFSFASELGALMASGLVEKKISLASLDKYLLMDYVPTPATILEKVYKLAPGSVLVYEKDSVRTEVFWTPPRELSSMSESEAMSELDMRLRESVAGQLMSDAPLGVYLSGGIDSSTTAWYASDIARERLHTFSIGFADTDFDESTYARQVAGLLKSEHYERIVTQKDALDTISSIPDVFSEPVADASVIPTLLLSEFASKTVKVSIGGDGGDELFAGYPTFNAETLYQLYGRLPSVIRTLNKSIINMLPPSDGNFGLVFNLKKFVSSDEENVFHRHIEWLGSFGAKERERLSKGTLALVAGKYPAFETVDHAADEYSQMDAGNKLLYVYARSYLMDQVLVKVDRASMHYGLEVRAPFLDYRLVDFVFSLPYAYKHRAFTGKRLLKSLMRNKLPDSIIDRKKQGFGVPLARWLKTDLRGLVVDVLSKRNLDTHGLFNSDYVLQLLTSHFDGKADNRKQIWNLLTFQLWYDRWMA